MRITHVLVPSFPAVIYDTKDAECLNDLSPLGVSSDIYRH